MFSQTDVKGIPNHGRQENFNEQDPTTPEQATLPSLTCGAALRTRKHLRQVGDREEEAFGGR